MKSLVFLLSFCSITISCTESELPDTRLNDIQIIGSHNSYKIAIDEPILDYISNKDSMQGVALEYDHIGMTEQLELGLRSLEIDIYYDPQGGYYKNPRGLDIVREAGQEPVPFDTEGKLSQPGLKVFHIQEVDFRSHHLLFKDALRTLVNWSGKHPNHMPIIVVDQNPERIAQP